MRRCLLPCRKDDEIPLTCIEPSDLNRPIKTSIFIHLIGTHKQEHLTCCYTTRWTNLEKREREGEMRVHCATRNILPFFHRGEIGSSGAGSEKLSVSKFCTVHLAAWHVPNQ